MDPTSPSTPKDERKPALASCLSLPDIEKAAERILKPRVFAFIKAGADDEWSSTWNERIFAHIRFRPRILIDISKISLSTTIMGQPTPLPILIAPASMARRAHPDGEIALVRAAAKWGIPMVSCTNASYGYEEVVRERREGQVMFYQVNIHKDRSVTARALRRVKELGYKGIMVTVDSPVVGNRPRDERANIITEDEEGGNVQKAVAGSRGLAKSTSDWVEIKLLWDDLHWIRSIVGPSMPIAVKGIQTADDAAICARLGANVYLSNHGGRQLNGAPSSIETLLEIRKHCPWVFDLVEVYVDGGFRRGTDIIKAIALGARGVLLGRPFLFSLAFGQEGAEKTIGILAEEVETAMRLLGVTDISQLRPECVNAKELEQNISSHYNGPGKPWFGNLFGGSLKAKL